MFEDYSLAKSCSAEQAAVALGLYGSLLVAGVLAGSGLFLAFVRHPEPWTRQIEDLRSRPWRWGDAAFIAAAVIVLLLASLALTSAWQGLAPSHLMILESLTFDGLGLLILAYYMQRRGLVWPSAFGLQRTGFLRHARVGLLAYLAALPVMFFASVVYETILSAKGYPTTMQDVALLLAGARGVWVRLYLTLLAVLLAPFFEECVFRGVLLPLLARQFGTGPAVLLSSALFAAIHWHLPSFVPLLVMASSFALGYLYSGSLWVPVTMHAAFNTVNLTILLILRP
jgi:membrane protease YdiL (CAAX protease family)